MESALDDNDETVKREKPNVDGDKIFPLCRNFFSVPVIILCSVYFNFTAERALSSR